MEEQFRLDFVEKIQNIVSKEELQIIDGYLHLGGKCFLGK